MASTGTALYPGASTFPGASVFPGQGTNYIARCYLSTDDASVGELRVWTDVTSKMRSYSTARGRNSERDQFDAGTATVVLDNRDRSFDPVINSAIKPLNQIWLFEEFSGERQDIFKGYAETIQQNWDSSGIVDATATFTCADEFKVLSLSNLPVTNPPRSTYKDIVDFDTPTAYYPLDDPAESLTQNPATGPMQLGSFFPGATAAFASLSPGAIVGDPNSVYMSLPNGAAISGPLEVTQGDPGDAADLTDFTTEIWFD